MERASMTPCKIFPREKPGPDPSGISEAGLTKGPENVKWYARQESNL